MRLRDSPFVLAVALALSSACGPPREPIRLGAGGSVPESPDDTLDPDVPHAWMWRVSGEDALRPSYILGTMHLGVSSRDAVPTPLDAALFDAQPVVREVDLREAERFLSTQVGTPLRRRDWLDRALAPETWDRLVAELGSRAPASFLRQIPPGALANYLQQVRMAEVEAIEDGRVPVPGVTSSTRLDRSIFQWAITAGTPVVALETPEEAIAALQALPSVDALEALRALVDDPDAARLEARRLRDAYLSLDADRVLEIIGEAPPGFNEILLEGRNRAWMERLHPEIRRGDAFIAVGCAHLLAEPSLLTLLRAEGYEIDRVMGDGGLEPSGRDDTRIH